MLNRKSTAYNQIVGLTKNGSIFVLDDTFAYGDGFHGAVRYEMRPLYQGEIDNGNDPETIKEYYKDLWVEAVKNDTTEESLMDYVQGFIDDCEDDPDRYFPMDDPSFRPEMDKAWEKLDEATKAKLKARFGDFVDWTCDVCGRCGKEINEDYFEEIYRPDLLKAIQEAEA